MPKNLFSVRNLVLIAMFSALAFILMFLEFPIPFIAPGFYKMDLSELPVLVGSFALGPIAGILIEALKIVLHLLFKGTSTAYVGELGNFLVGIALSLPASIIYMVRHTRKGALVGMIAGTLIMAIAGAFMNGFVLLPMYAGMFGGMDKIIAAGTAVWGGVNSVFTFVALCVVPFNLLKGILTSIITFLIYKYISRLINKVGH